MFLGGGGSFSTGGPGAEGDSKLGGGNSNIYYFHPYLGRWSNLTNIFQGGWNHQLEKQWADPWDGGVYLPTWMVTLPKTNIETENQRLEDEILFRDGLFFRGYVSFREGNFMID